MKYSSSVHIMTSKLYFHDSQSTFISSFFSPFYFPSNRKEKNIVSISLATGQLLSIQIFFVFFLWFLSHFFSRRCRQLRVEKHRQMLSQSVANAVDLLSFLFFSRKSFATEQAQQFCFSVRSRVSID